MLPKHLLLLVLGHQAHRTGFSSGSVILGIVCASLTGAASNRGRFGRRWLAVRGWVGTRAG